MGKKPVVGLIGLVWAGIALTGCGECCRNNTRNNTYNPKPSWQMKEGTAPKAPVADKGVGMDLPQAKPPEVSGVGSISETPPPSGPGASPMSSHAAPKDQKSLRSPVLDDGPDTVPAPRSPDLRPRETGSLREIKHETGIPMPARPLPMGASKVDDPRPPALDPPPSPPKTARDEAALPPKPLPPPSSAGPLAPPPALDGGH
jgi:hypothetical protein